MFYQFANTIEKIPQNALDPNIITAGYITIDELTKCYSDFGFSLATIDACKDDVRYYRSSIEVYDDYCFGTLKITDPEDSISHEDYIAFYVKKNLLLLVEVQDDNCSLKKKFDNALSRFQPKTITLEKIVYSYFNALIDGDNKSLEDKEFRINKLEEYVLTNQATKDFNLNLHHMKKELLILRNYYEQLIDIGEALQENENDIFENEDLRYFKIFTNKAIRLKDNVLLLSESLVQLGDAYKSTLDISQNNLMATFTVITAIFLPLTVIVGWYGMNFQSMPEFKWKYGYIFVITLSVMVVGILGFIFKKKKWI